MTTPLSRTLLEWFQHLTGATAPAIAQAESRALEQAEADASIRRTVEHLDAPPRVA